jgi:hypothetical protein
LPGCRNAQKSAQECERKEHESRGKRRVKKFGEEEMHATPTPMFFVNVASKRVSHSASLLFATLARGSISVAAKGFRLPRYRAKWAVEKKG